MTLEHAFSPISNSVTLSLGVAAIIPTNETSPQDLVKMADRALYCAKAKGRNRVSIWQKL